MENVNLPSDEEIKSLYSQGRISQPEMMLLYAMKSGDVGFTRALFAMPPFMLTGHGWGLNDYDIERHITVILQAIYSLNEKFPKLNIKEYMIYLMNDEYRNKAGFTGTLSYWYYILVAQSKGYATFVIDQQWLLDHLEWFKNQINNKSYVNTIVKRNELEKIVKYNKFFKSELNFDLAEGNEYLQDAIARHYGKADHN